MCLVGQCETVLHKEEHLVVEDAPLAPNLAQCQDAGPMCNLVVWVSEGTVQHPCLAAEPISPGILHTACQLRRWDVPIKRHEQVCTPADLERTDKRPALGLGLGRRGWGLWLRWGWGHWCLHMSLAEQFVQTTRIHLHPKERLLTLGGWLLWHCQFASWTGVIY